MEPKRKAAMPIPVALDEELLAAIDRAVALKGETRSAVMRAALRLGLPLVESGAAGLFIQLDGALRMNIREAAQKLGVSEERVMVEAIRIGVGPYYARQTERFIVEGRETNREQFERLYPELAGYSPLANPDVQDRIRLVRQLRELAAQTQDLESQVPAARARLEKLRHLAALRPAGRGHGHMSYGVPNEELDRQIAELEGGGAPARTRTRTKRARPA